MAIDANVDPMAYLEEAINRPKSTGGDFTPFFFAIKDGEKALIRPLLNMPQYVRVYKHEYYDNATKTWKFRNLCAADQDLDCQCCLDVEAMPEGDKEQKKAKRAARRSERMILPVYLHTVVNIKTGAVVTYTQDDKEIPVSGPRLLEMKPESSDILHDLLKSYQASESHDITKRDFKIERRGAGIDTKYDTTPKDVSPFTIEVPAEYLSKGSVFDLYSNACPPKIVGQDAAPAQSFSSSNGAVKTAPDF